MLDFFIFKEMVGSISLSVDDNNESLLITGAQLWHPASVSSTVIVWWMLSVPSSLLASFTVDEKKHFSDF